MKQIIFFSCSSHQELAQSISKRLGLPLGRAILSTFSNGETSVEIGDSVREKDVFILQTFDPPHSHSRLMELLIMISACKTASAHKVIAVIPLFPYGKAGSGTATDELLYHSNIGWHYRPWRPRAGKLIANLLMVAGTDHVITLDVHDPQYQGFFDIPFDHLRFQPLFIKWVQDNKHAMKSPMIVSPDTGGAKRATSMAKDLGIDFALIHDVNPTKLALMSACHTKEPKLIGGVSGRTVLLVDDIAITCKTLVRAAEICLKEGAESVIALVTHALFANIPEDNVEKVVSSIDSEDETEFQSGVLLLASSSSISKIVVSNSLPNISQRTISKLGSQRIVILDTAPLLAEAIRRIHFGESVSYLFDRVAI